MVAAKTGLAAEAGANVLARGGNAVDAAVTTCLVAAVVEPWMNGIGGGGYMVIHQPGQTSADVVSYPMQAPAGATEDMFPLGGSAAGFFGWPSVIGNANVAGHRSVGVPGTIAGLSLALERFGTISFAEAAGPAIEFAERGFPVTWHTTLKISGDLAMLNRFPATRAIFTNDGVPHLSLDEHAPFMLKQSELASTLRTLASEGPRAFYEGEIARAIIAELESGGAPFAAEDLANYEASVEPSLSMPYGDAVIHAPGKATGGTTMLQSLKLIDALGVRSLETG
jgi:gamma-glutamyltranspeptidase/glutathione hydrolase